VIPAFDYRPEYERHKQEIDQAIERVLRSGQLVLGPEVESFEREFADAVGAVGTVGVNSGTDALTLALRALEIGPGDEVITVANAGVPPVAAIRAVGASPRFVDVHPGTLLLDVSALEAALTPRTRCVLPVHLYGQPAPLDPICAFAREQGLRVVEDCAQAHGAHYRGRHVGTFGDVGCFSFYPTKNLGAFGDGGACVSGDPELIERIRPLRMYGFRNDRHAHREGVNSRLDELQAAILRVKLAHLDESVADRRELAELYLKGLADSWLQPLERAADGRHAYHLFVVRSEDRAAAIEALERGGIGYGVQYPEPVHRMEAYRFMGYRAGDLPVTERAADRVLSLPLYPGLPVAAVEQVLRTLLAAT
jgi:dTDP-4-amino-4,6-dideoxygalactose transaminase